MFFWTKTQALSAVIYFPTFTGSLDPLTSFSDPLEASIISPKHGFSSARTNCFERYFTIFSLISLFEKVVFI